ncbi:ABC transporter permease [Desulfatibacillum aliphaticivorans]|nr:ABC transporter permease [Desulfatibacillum aliphaticivorans]
MNNRLFANTRAIMARELRGYFGSPLAYVLIVIFLLLNGFFTFFISGFYEMEQADLRDAFFRWHPWLFLVLVPAVAMRLWAEERRQGTMELILTLPITLGEAILGKFLAAWFFIAVSMILTFPLVLTTAYLGDPDLGAIFCGYVGSILLGGAYLSVGSMTSAITRNQVISFVAAAMICLFLVLAGYPPVTDPLADWVPKWIVDIVAGFSVMTHYQSMQKGVIDFRDLLYYGSLMFFMLFANGVILQARRSS